MRWSPAACRFGSRFPEGVVTTLNPDDLPLLHSAMQQPSDPLEGACIFPRYEALSLFASQHHKVPSTTEEMGFGGGQRCNS